MGARAVHHRDYAPIPDLLRQMREEAGLTQRELAEKLLRVQQSISTSESGSRRVDVGEFCRWAEACGISPGEALDQYLMRRPKRPKRP